MPKLAKRITILVAGDYKVGKSTLINRYRSPTKFNPEETQYIDYFEYTITIEKQTYEIFILSYMPQYHEEYNLRRANGIIMLYDVANPSSLEFIDKLIPTVQELNNHFFVSLVGNKQDLKSERKISYEDGLKRANTYKSKFYEISAFDYDAISTLITLMIKEIIVNSTLYDTYKLEDYRPEVGGGCMGTNTCYI
jgi:Ras-related protein Rab-6A